LLSQQQALLSSQTAQGSSASGNPQLRHLLQQQPMQTSDIVRQHSVTLAGIRQPQHGSGGLMGSVMLTRPGMLQGINQQGQQHQGQSDQSNMFHEDNL